MRRATAAGAAAGLLLLRLVWPGLFTAVRGLLVDERGDEVVRAVFRQYAELPDDGAVRVFGEDG
jgi:hypothetical protein